MPVASAGGGGLSLEGSGGGVCPVSSVWGALSFAASETRGVIEFASGDSGEDVAITDSEGASSRILNAGEATDVEGLLETAGLKAALNSSSVTHVPPTQSSFV